MTFTYEPGSGSSRDLVRLLIPDRDTDNVIYQNEELDAFINMEGGALQAAASALETLASNEAYIQKVMKLGDLQTNGAETAKVLLSRAKTLRDRALEIASADSSSLFDWAQWGVDSFTESEIIWKDFSRQAYLWLE